jgi:hypothetical protein
MLELWTDLVVEATLLSFEAHSVIGLRLSQIALGQGSAAEAQLMINEKMIAFAEAATTVVTGGSAHSVVDGYRRHVQANAHRLRQD